MIWGELALSNARILLPSGPAVKAKFRTDLANCRVLGPGWRKIAFTLIDLWKSGKANGRRKLALTTDYVNYRLWRRQCPHRIQRIETDEENKC